MFIIAGLGNPGRQYQDNRHNIGFMALDAIKRAHSFSPWSKKFKSEISEGTIGTEKVLLMKPQTFMNLSGTAVTALARHLQLEPESILVVYDDMDLDLGRLRIRAHGGPGTHNGMRSIVASLGTDRFPRVRVGIGQARTDAARHVLERFSTAEMQDAEISVAEAADAIRAWLGGEDLDGVMTRFHSRWNTGA